MRCRKPGQTRRASRAIVRAYLRPLPDRIACPEPGSWEAYNYALICLSEQNSPDWGGKLG